MTLTKTATSSGLATEDETAQTVAVVWRRTNAPIRAAATTLSSSNVSAARGKTISLSASLRQSSDGAPIGGKTITFKINGTAAGSAATNAAGVATQSYTIPVSMGAGVKAIAVAFAGDPTFQASSGSATLTIGGKAERR